MRTLESQAAVCARAQWAVALGIAVLLAGAYLFGCRPLSQRQAELQMQIDAKQRQLQASQDQTRRLPEIARRVDTLRLRLEHFDKKLPRRDDFSEFMRQMTLVSQQAALQDWSLTKGLARRSDALCELPVLLSFKGNFVAVCGFVRQLEEMQRITRVRKLEVKATDAAQGTVEVKMTVNIYSVEG